MNSFLSFSNSLLTWYDANRRVLPWRGSRDPYIIWISEIIFQQTRISQGTSYYLRFIERFPDILTLAAAPEDDVLKVWQGLGYYSRARNMHATAQLIVDQYAGVFPTDIKTILRLKGVGDYTASCIASICFHQPEAAVDGNVYRVLSRIFLDKTPVNSAIAQKRFKEYAQELIDLERPGDFNEAMMDLGAMVCIPRSPLCKICPVSSWCEAFKKDEQSSVPVKTKSGKRSVREMKYLLIESEDQIAIRKRMGSGIWKGMYELPEPVGLTGSPVKMIVHPLSHVDLSIHFYRKALPNKALASEPGLLWIPKKEISQYPFPKPLADFLDELF